MIKIGFLADHPESVPSLARWFRAQWPDYFAPRSQTEMEQDFLRGATRDRLPCRLVAFDAGALAGTIILRADNPELPPAFQPELGGLFVTEALRGRGVATRLVQAGMQLAGDLGYRTLFATTVSAAGILERCGWVFVQTVAHTDEVLALYRCDVSGQGDPQRA
jgi:RimJ/RimL family protein N-acetyltransferase